MFKFLRFGRKDDTATLSSQHTDAQLLAELKNFTLKNPGPLQKFAADLLGYDSKKIRKPYSQSVWVYKCMNTWTRLAQVPLDVVDKDGKVIEFGKEAFLFGSPSASLSMSEFQEQLIISMANSGNFFILKDDGTTFGIPKNLNVINSARMSFDAKDVDLITGQVRIWKMSMGHGKEIKVDSRGLIHGMLPNPYSKQLGISPLEALRVSIDADYAARIHNKFQMEKHGRVAGIVSFKEQMGGETLALAKKLYDEKYKGADNAGETLFMDNDARYHQMSLSTKDMDWLEGQKISREEICAAFNVPPNVAGILDKATYSNYEQASKVLWEEGLVPLGNRIASKLSRELLGSSKFTCAFRWQSVDALQTGQKERSEIYEKLVRNKVSPKAAAASAGVDIGEPAPEHDEIWITVGEIPASEYTAPAPEPEKTVEYIERVVERIVEVPDTKELSFQLRVAKARNIERDAVAAEKAMETTLKNFFYAQRKSVLKRAATVESQLKSFAPEATKILANTSQELALQWLSEKNWDAELLKRLTPIIYDISEAASKRLLREIGQDTDRFSQTTLQGFYKQQGILIKKINKTTYDALQKSAQTLVENVQAGISIDDTMTALSSDLKGVYNNTEARRRTIARTETLRTVNGARFEQMKASGLQFKEWMAVLDSETRPTHMELDGTTVPMGTDFVIPGTDRGISYPLDPSAPAGETINCRCVMAAKVKADE